MVGDPISQQGHRAHPPTTSGRKNPNTSNNPNNNNRQYRPKPWSAKRPQNAPIPHPRDSSSNGAHPRSQRSLTMMIVPSMWKIRIRTRMLRMMDLGSRSRRGMAKGLLPWPRRSRLSVSSISPSLMRKFLHICFPPTLPTESEGLIWQKTRSQVVQKIKTMQQRHSCTWLRKWSMIRISPFCWVPLISLVWAWRNWNHQQVIHSPSSSTRFYRNRVIILGIRIRKSAVPPNKYI